MPYRIGIINNTIVFISLILLSCTKKSNNIMSEYPQRRGPVKATYIEYKDINLEKIDVHSKNEKKLVLKNKSKKAVVLNAVSASCSCLSFKFKKNIIPPNDSISVMVYFTPETQRGYFSKIIFITLNNGKNYITPYIYGIIDNMNN